MAASGVWTSAAPPPPVPANGTHGGDTPGFHHLNTQLGLLHSQFQQIFDASDRAARENHPTSSPSWRTSGGGGVFSPADRFEIPTSPVAAGKHRFGGGNSGGGGTSTTNTTVDSSLDDLAVPLGDPPHVQFKQHAAEKEQLIATLEQMGLPSTQWLPVLSLASPQGPTSSGVPVVPTALGDTLWYQKDYWRTKYTV